MPLFRTLSFALFVLLVATVPVSTQGSADYAKQLEHAEVNGTDIPYVQKGRGSTVILIHDAVADLRVWGPVVDTLAAKYKVIAYSMRGHFPNTWNVDGPDYSAAQHAEDLMAFLKILKVGKVALVGHGYGGRVAALVASKRPEMVAGVVMAEPTIFTVLDGTSEAESSKSQTSGLMSAVVDALKTADPTAMCRAYVDTIGESGTFDALPADQRKQLADNVTTLMPMVSYSQIGRFGCDDAKRIKCPVLLVQGEATKAVWKAVNVKLAECFPNDTAVAVPGSGHRMVTERPDAFGRILLDFLATL